RRSRPAGEPAVLDVEARRVDARCSPGDHEVRHAAIALELVDDELGRCARSRREELRDARGRATFGRVDDDVTDPRWRARARVVFGPTLPAAGCPEWCHGHSRNVHIRTRARSGTDFSLRDYRDVG